MNVLRINDKSIPFYYIKVPSIIELEEKWGEYFEVSIEPDSYTYYLVNREICVTFLAQHDKEFFETWMYNTITNGNPGKYKKTFEFECEHNKMKSLTSHITSMGLPENRDGVEIFEVNITFDELVWKTNENTAKKIRRTKMMFF